MSACVNNDVLNVTIVLNVEEPGAKGDIVKSLKMDSRETRRDCWGRATSIQGCTHTQDLFKLQCKYK